MTELSMSLGRLEMRHFWFLSLTVFLDEYSSQDIPEKPERTMTDQINEVSHFQYQVSSTRLVYHRQASDNTMKFPYSSSVQNDVFQKLLFRTKLVAERWFFGQKKITYFLGDHVYRMLRIIPVDFETKEGIFKFFMMVYALIDL
jgi:hypothetical protein